MARNSKEKDSAAQDNIYYGISNCSKKMDMVVCKSKPLLNLTKSNMNLLELKLFDLYLARINPNDDSKDIVVFSKSELEKMLRVSRVESSRLEKTLEHLMGYVVTLFLEPKHKKKLTLFSQADLEYEDEAMKTTPTIKLQCNPYIKKYIFKPDAIGYLRTNINLLTSFKTRNAYSLYQYLGQNKFRGEWTVSLDALKSYMGLSGHYDNYKDFKKDVLTPSIKEIKEKTGMDVGYNLVTRNRKAQGLKFFFWKDDEETKYVTPAEETDEERPFFLTEEPKDSFSPDTDIDDNIFEGIEHLIF